MAERLKRWSVMPRILGSSPSLGKIQTLKTLVQLQRLSDLHEKHNCTITPGSMSLLNCEIYQRGRLSRVADTELTLLIAYLIQPPGPIPGVR